MKTYYLIHDLFTYEACIFKNDTLRFVTNFNKIVYPIYNYDGGYISSCYGGNDIVCTKYKIKNYKAIMTGKPQYSKIDDWIKK